MAMADSRRLEYKLVHDALLLEVDVVETDVRPAAGDDEDVAVRIQLQADASLIQSSVHGLLFALGALSFNDARPSADAGAWLAPGDQFTATDLLEHLRFERNGLRLHVGSLRGRRLDTTIEVKSDGKVLLETANRGRAAVGWVTRLQGKQLLAPAR